MPKFKYRFKKTQEISRRHYYRLLREKKQTLDLPIQNIDQCEGTSVCYNNSPSSRDVIVDNVDSDDSSNCLDSDLENSDLDAYSESNSVIISQGSNNSIALQPQDTINSVSKNNNTQCKELCSANYLSNLANWAVAFQINSNAVNALLKIQREEPGYDSLPKDCRTLLQTPRTTLTRKVEPGEYYHCGLLNAIKLFVKSKSLCNEVLNIKVFVGIDGLPISKSSKSVIWPILCHFKIDNLDCIQPEVYPIGVYHGYDKPRCSNDFIKDFVEEATNLVETGYKCETSNVILHIEIAAIICDVPAKSFIFKTKGHCGFYSCSRCDQKGESKNSRVYFPLNNCNKRTHATFIERCQNEYHTGETILVHLPGFDVVKNVPLDYMHLICLGVVKKLMHFWLFQPKGRNRLQNHVVDEISSKLKSLSPYMPKEFVRKSRSLDDAKIWKATELRCFLLYTGPVVLKGSLTARLYLNFLTLGVALSIMLSKKYCSLYLEYADDLLHWWVGNFSNIYGEQYISHNVHNLIHLKEDVLIYGPLDECSAFPFESYLFQMKKLVIRKPEKPLQQFARRYSETLCNGQSVTKTTVVNNCKEYVLKKSHSEGPVFQQLNGLQYKEIETKDFTLNNAMGNNCCRLANDDTVIVSNFIECKEGIRLIGKKFMNVKDFFSKPCLSSKLGITFVSNLGKLQFWDVKCIAMKCVLFPYSDGFVVFPLLHCK